LAIIPLWKRRRSAAAVDGLGEKEEVITKEKAYGDAKVGEFLDVA